VAYDRGFVARNADGTVQTDPSGQVRGLAPSLTTAVVKNDVAGNVVAGVNTAVATPRAPAAGYVPPGLENLNASVVGTGSVNVEVLVPNLVQQQATYELTFTNPSPWQDSTAVAYRLVNQATGDVVDEGIVDGGRREI